MINSYILYAIQHEAYLPVGELENWDLQSQVSRAMDGTSLRLTLVSFREHAGECTALCPV